MSQFDPIKAAQEQLTGLVEVMQSLKRREHAAEEAVGIAERELNDIRKIVGFVRICIEEHRNALDRLRKEAGL